MSVFHPIILCQPDNKKSCGACCGQFNWQNHTRKAIQDILEQQTKLFLSLPNYNNLSEYKVQVNDSINNAKLFETIYNCEFLGFIDKEHTKTGCMLHPAVTKIPDLRNNCFYGTEICESHFCPGFECLRIVEQRAVIESIDDWYLYALIITDIDLVKEFFKHIENKMGESIKEKHLNKSGLNNALKDFFQLKENWGFRAKENRLGKYYFSKAEYNIARIKYREKWGVTPSPFDKILVSLESEFKSLEELRSAESIIEDKIQVFIKLYSQ
jgi:hypothetical protein